MTPRIKLPETPKVEARDTLVVILYDDGSEHTCGEEKTNMDAIKVARELEVELRAINYVRWHVHTFVEEMKALLVSYEINESLLTSILADGHGFAGPDLEDGALRSIFERAGSDQRKQVLDKIGSPIFIV